MKPYQVLLFFICVVLVLLVLSMAFPENGYHINSNLKLRFISFSEILGEDSVEYADISPILQQTIAPEPVKEVLPDLPVIENSPVSDTLRADPDSLKKIIHPIEFPSGKKTLFHPFFRKASSLKNRKELLRILHYGDSQIETDRITSYLRHRMQILFGGSGCGLIPAVPLYNGKMSIRQDYSGNWKRYTGFARIDTSLNHRRFGALFSFTSIRNNRNNPDEMAWLELSPSPYAYQTSKIYNQFTLYVSKSGTLPLEMDLYLDDSIRMEKIVESSFHYKKYQWNLPYTPNRLKLEFNPEPSLEVLGLSLDNSWGIAVDNIPLRGSAGLEFSKCDTTVLKRMYKDLNVGMLILQFGGNVVPYLESASAYEKFLKRELVLLKKLLPGVPILVIGPSDMSIKEKGRFVTYPNLEKVRDAMRRASLETGCSFWDMYEAMGGKNSMPSWVHAEPPLAVDDFVHFNIRGSRIIAEMIYNSIIYEYELWRRNGLNAEVN